MPGLKFSFVCCRIGKDILAFGDKVVENYAESLLTNGEDDSYTCSRFGGECSKDGSSVNLKIGNSAMRILLETGFTHMVAQTNSAETENDALKRTPVPEVTKSFNPFGSSASYSRNTLYGTFAEEHAPRPPPTRERRPPPPSSSPPLVPPPSPHSPQHPHSPHSPPPPPLAEYKPESKVTPLVVPLAVGIPVGFLIALLALYLLWRQSKRVKNVIPWKTGISGQLQRALVSGVPSLRRSELELACEDFSNNIGSLSHCSLYKGTLSSGVEITVASTAVTSAKDWSERHEAQFRKKISMMSGMNHKNFMNLIGYCVEENPFTRMMVFEYSSNGTLFEHLHDKEIEPLEWAARMRIAMGIVYCLQRNEQLDTPLTLKNLNSSSIYITEDLAAKISDLDFWTGEEAGTSHRESRNVYKFGILLLEILSGRLPYSEDDGLFVLWASSYLEGKRPRRDMIDSTLSSVSEESIDALTDLIKSCVNPEVSERPTMSEVVDKMRQITSLTPEKAQPSVSPLWWAEIEIITG